MFVILYYDVGEERCNRMLKTCRKYLTWVQNSVFEGEITLSALERLKAEINSIIEPDEGDSVVIYTFRSMTYSKREVLGSDKRGDTQFL